MITRAIINKIDYDTGKIRVRIPIYDGAQNVQGSTADEDLSWASIMCIPGLTIDYTVGDIVIVSFEDGDLGKPIILGYLRLTDGSSEQAKVSANLDNLTVNNALSTSTNVKFGKLTYEQIFNKVEN